MRRTPSTTTPERTRLSVPLLSLLFAAACGTTPPSPAPAPDNAEHEIEAMLHASAEAWSRGDLEGYLDDYAPDATFVGSSGLTRGRDQIRQAYVTGYWSTGMPEDGLRFRLLEVREVGPSTALAVGRYILYDRDTGETTATGIFSLTLRQGSGGWKIVHDHSSADDG